ncbi:reverse transcriptase domain-containing protein [Tanacetum coccineum]
MAEEDENKTTFFTGEGVYYYRKMPFGLKNARATYQRLVDKVFNDQIGRNLKAYIDDIVIKSTSEEDMLADINETFQSYQYGNLPHEGPKPIAVRPSMKLGQSSYDLKALPSSFSLPPFITSESIVTNESIQPSLLNFIKAFVLQLTVSESNHVLQIALQTALTSLKQSTLPVLVL